MDWIGSDYGGWNVAPLKEKAIVYSFGLGEDSSFDFGVIEKYKALVYAFDPTPMAIDYVNKNRLFDNINFSFYPWAVSNKDGMIKLYPHVNKDFVTMSPVECSGWTTDGAIEVEAKTIETIMKTFGHRKVDYVKIILGGYYEYYVIKNMLEDGIKPEQLSFLSMYFESDQKYEITRRLENAGYKILHNLRDNERQTWIM